MSFLIGITLATGVAVFARRTGLDRDRAYYPTVMIVIAVLYILFAAIDGSTSILLFEIPFAAGFIALSLAGFRRSLWFVVAALAAHGVYDIFHPHLVHNRGVPVFWPHFCSAYDIAAAAILAWQLWTAPIGVTLEAISAPRSVGPARIRL
jgi:hypothetical protein